MSYHIPQRQRPDSEITQDFKVSDKQSAGYYIPNGLDLRDELGTLITN